MSGSSLQGRWAASSVTEEDIAKLRAERYLTAEILHRLPAEGQVIPTPRSGERVVFVSHFLRGLGFTLNPFVRGLMFYYGMDFHDLPPNSVLLISAFIVTCEAFLRIPPHFGLWLKTFNVKPQVIEGKLAECSGATVSKLNNALWLKGSFTESSDLWQREWFYITEPRGSKWAAAPAFRSSPPTQLASWINKGLDWGSVDEVQTLQSRIRSLLEKDIDLINVVQVMLARRTLPCQRRPLRLWEFNPQGARTLQHFFGTTHKGMWKLFFGKRKQWPDTTEDIGPDCNHPDTPVSAQLPNTLSTL